MNKQSPNLIVSHTIFLNKEEIERLFSGLSVRTIGCSVPVWFQKGTTSEPAEEVFAQYYISTKKSKLEAKTFDAWYKINIPKLTADYEPPERIPDDLWREMPIIEREIWYDNNTKPISVDDLMDAPLGGNYLKFKHLEKLEYTTIVHFVEINTVERLMESLIF